VAPLQIAGMQLLRAVTRRAAIIGLKKNSVAAIS
jgi:hypothetical protein